jgi:hypothetical protein
MSAPPDGGQEWLARKQRAECRAGVPDPPGEGVRGPDAIALAARMAQYPLIDTLWAYL